MKICTKFYWVAATAAAFVLTGCGGGSGNGAQPPPPPPPPPDSGIEGSGVALGSISGFGSVIVNGVRYDTSAAAITVDGEAATEADLSVGDVVLIVGEVDASGTEGSAESVSLDHILEGPITAIDAALGTLTVLGQTVTIDALTSFDDDILPPSIDGLAIDDRIEVSGFVAADGSVIATRIERDDDTELEITGTVSALDTSALTFDINGQTIDYAMAVLTDFPAEGIANGDLVEAKGNDFDAGGALIALSVEFKSDDFDFDDGDELEIEGPITRFGSATDFDVAGIPVVTDASTVFEGGSADDLALNLRVEVEGDFNADGVLLADKVQIKRDSNIRISAPVDSVGVDSLVVLGVTVEIDALTRFEDKSDLDIEQFGLDDISVGDFVEVRGSESADTAGVLAAAILERDDPEDEAEVRGPVDSVDLAASSLVIFGVTVNTGVGTEYEDLNDLPLTAVEFFAQVAVGALVEADGTVTASGTLLADELSFEDD